MTDSPRYTPPAYVEQSRQRRALARRPQPCMLCGEWTKTVLYPCGWHCEACAAKRGLQPVAAEVTA
jgi:hypothetical protein